MPKQFLELVTLFTAFFIVGLNTGELTCLANVGSPGCLSCLGVG
jgi:hypothetical protein